MLHEIHTHTHTLTKVSLLSLVFFFSSLENHFFCLGWAQWMLSQVFCSFCSIFLKEETLFCSETEKKILHSLEQLVLSVPDGTWFHHQNLANTLFLSVELFYFIFYILHFTIFKPNKIANEHKWCRFFIFFFRFVFRQNVHIRIKCECHHHHVWPDSNRTCITI